MRSDCGLSKTSSGRALLDDDAAVHEDDAVRDVAGEAHLVRDHEHRHAALGQVLHDVEDAAHELGVERRGDLVEEHDVRVHGQRPRDGDALLLAAGELRREVVGAVRQAHLGEALVGDRRRPRPSCGCSTRCWASITLPLAVRCGNRLKLWNTMPTFSRTLLMSVLGSLTWMSSKKILPPVGSSSRLTQRSSVDLPEPDGPEDDDDLALRDVHVHVLEHLEVAEGLAPGSRCGRSACPRARWSLRSTLRDSGGRSRRCLLPSCLPHSSVSPGLDHDAPGRLPAASAAASSASISSAPRFFLRGLLPEPPSESASRCSSLPT